MVDLPPTEGANYFHLSTRGPEVQLLVGYIDLFEVHQAAAKLQRGTLASTAPRVTASVSHRFLLSFVGLVRLRDQIDEIVTLLRNQGVAVPPPPSMSNDDKR